MCNGRPYRRGAGCTVPVDSLFHYRRVVRGCAEAEEADHHARYVSRTQRYFLPVDADMRLRLDHETLRRLLCLDRRKVQSAATDVFSV